MDFAHATVDGGLGAANQPQLAQHVAHMPLRRPLRHVQRLGDLLVGAPLRQQRQHLALPLRQLLGHRLRPLRLGQGLQERLLHRLGQVHHPLRRPPDGGRQLARGQVLGHVADRPRPQGLPNLDAVGVGAQHHHGGPGQRRMDAAGGLDPVEGGHLQVHEHHVGLQGLGHRLQAVGGLADHLQVGLGGQEQAQAGADHGVVVGQQHPDGCLSGRL